MLKKFIQNMYSFDAYARFNMLYLMKMYEIRPKNQTLSKFKEKISLLSTLQSLRSGEYLCIGCFSVHFKVYTCAYLRVF